MMNKRPVLFIDSGDTLIDEATQIRDEKGIVLEAMCIPGADTVLRRLHAEGYTIALVADGEWASFQNIFQKNGLADCFDVWVVSEIVGQQKPAPLMFDTAMHALHLTQEDCTRIVMVGNNLKKDIAGANRRGLISVWLDWSPRYYHTIEEADWAPRYTIHTLDALLPLLHALEEEMNENMEEGSHGGHHP